NTESFLHRLSFEAQPRLLQQRRLTGNGIEGTAGSTRGSELYVRSHLRLHADLNERWFAEASHRRSEDFDGRYDTLLTGAGVRHHKWQAALLADVEGAKENIDMHLRLGWQASDDQLLRLSIVGSDVPFNDKQSSATYDRQPYTAHLYGAMQPWEALQVRGFLNLNMPMRLDHPDSGMRSEDEGIAAGISAHLSLGDQWHMAMSLEGRYRLRHSWLDDIPDDPMDTQFPEQRLRRNNLVAKGEVGTQHHDGSQSWMGMRAFYLKETDRRPSDDSGAEHINRREYTIYAGHRRHIHGHWHAAPSIFLARHDIEIDRPHVDPDDDDREVYERDVGFYGKFSPTLEYRVLADRQGVISLIPHFRLHRAAFGGGNVQVFLPF
ncbi:MAG: hypothetical protein EA401_00180, partial [Planctomycetota bacterium]